MTGACGGREARRGFTLVETLIALVLSSFVIVLVSHVFLVQNRFYATQTLRTGAQDNVRAATELMASEIRTTLSGGVVVAGPRTLVVRSPVRNTMVCSHAAYPSVDVFAELGDARDSVEVAGVAVRDPLTGDWEAANATWGTLVASSVGSASSCRANGADTVGAIGSFSRLQNLGTLLTSVPAEGDVVMLFRETTFKIQQSQLDPGAYGLFRGSYGDPLVEFATGIDTTARFQYRTAGGTYVDTVSAGSLAGVDVVRIVAEARTAPPTGGVDAVTFGWTVNVHLRTVR